MFAKVVSHCFQLIAAEAFLEENRLPLQEIRRLAADHRHAAVCPFEAFVADVVLEFFVPDGLAERRSQVIIGSVGANDRAEIGLLSGEEAGAELPICR